MSVVANDVLRVVASFLWIDGDINQNVFNIRAPAAGGPWDDTDVVDDMEDWLDNMYANFVNIITEDVAGNEVIVYKWDAVGGDWDEVGSQSWGFTPTYTASYLPKAVAALVRLWTTDPDVQGKKYIPGLTQGHNTDGLWLGSMLTALLAFGADWYLPFVGSATGVTFTPGIWSVVGSLFRAGVDHIAANAIPAYQRRRIRNVGI